MALILANAAPLKPEVNLAQALDDYGKILSDEERKQLYAQGPPDAMAAINFTTLIDRDCSTRRRRSYTRLWQVSFEQEFGSFEKEIRRSSEEIQAEVSLASKQAQKQESELQAEDRSEARKYRSMVKRLSKSFHQSNAEGKVVRSEVDRRKAKKRKMQALDSLSTYDYQSTYKQIRKECVPGTSTWILQDAQFKAWKEGNQKGLWCSGKCNPQKPILRVLSACVIAGIMESTSPKDITCFHFCRFDNQESLKASTIIGSIARQLVIDLPDDSFSDFEHGSPIGDFLESSLNDTRQYFIILDGLDECNETQIREVSETLYSLLSSLHLHVKIFWCSRPNIPDWISSKLQSQQHINLETVESRSQVASDIERFIDITLEELLESDTPRLQIGDPTLVLMIQDRLKKEAHGIQKKSDRQIIDTLNHLPRDLPETFGRILANFTEPEDVAIGKQIFRWLAVAKRPLTVHELREAIAIEPLQDVWKPECFVNDMNKAVACCGNLVLVEEEQQTMHFTHSSVRQYLCSDVVTNPQSRYHVDLDTADADAGAICVTYLNLPVFKKQIARTPKVNLNTTVITSAIVKNTLPAGRSSNKIALNLLRRRDKSSKSVQRLLEETAGINELTRQVATLEQYSFLSYAQRFWLEHTKQRISPRPGKLWRLWCNLLENTHWRDTLASCPWTFEDWEKGSTKIAEWTVENNHCSLAQLLYDSEKARTNENLRILFQDAAGRGCRELIELRLTLGKVSSTVLQSSLQSAALGGHLAVVEILLQAKADVNAAASYSGGRTALQSASWGGYLAVVERLLQAKADVNAAPADDFGITALEAAAGGGHLAVVERLLQAKADVNATPAKPCGRTGLQAAAEGGHLAVVERLLQEKADVNAAASYSGGRTALQAAAGGGHLAVVERLLQEKADVNADYPVGRTALQAAAERGHLAVVERLLQEKADVNAGYPIGGTALKAAADGGHQAVVERLEAAGAAFYPRLNKPG
ncbi:MAG: hypothetical protein Q9199_004740 [Rusavskia elegans]